MNWLAASAGLAGVAGAGVCAWAATHPRAQLFGPCLYNTGRADAVALTFDDGPNPAMTPELLRLLEQHGARATFFLIGRHARACPELVREIAARGHTIGNHTETHPNLFWCSPARNREELERCQEAIREAAGIAPRWMRPPYGYRGPQLAGAARRAGCRVVMWSVIARDWKPQPAEELIGRLRGVSGGDIVVLHDGSPRALGADRRWTLEALKYWLPRWREAGRAFVTLDEVAAPGT